MRRRPARQFAELFSQDRQSKGDVAREATRALELTSLVRERGTSRPRRSSSRALAHPANAASADRLPASETRSSAPPGTLLAVKAVATAVRIFRVAPPEGFRYVAGQSVKLGVDRGRKRHTYSIASAPHEPHLEFCIELVPSGRLTPMLFTLKEGARFDLGRAKGDFVLDKSASTHLMVATVTGIAPFRSILQDALARGSRDRFLILHGASYPDELPYREEMETLANQHAQVDYTPTVSRPGTARSIGWTGHTGRVDPLAESVGREFDPRTTAVYACGNSGMIANVRQMFRSRGFKVHSEAFD